jgi:hypothetical protein
MNLAQSTVSMKLSPPAGPSSLPKREPASVKGFVIISNATYQMTEIEPSEMGELSKEGDSQLWPLRFDSKKRIWPPRDTRGQDWEPFYYD